MTIGNVGLLLCGILFFGGGLFLLKKNWSLSTSERWYKVIDVVSLGLIALGLVCLFTALRALGT
jgi:hypothetical protein